MSLVIRGTCCSAHMDLWMYAMQCMRDQSPTRGLSKDVTTKPVGMLHVVCWTWCIILCAQEILHTNQHPDALHTTKLSLTHFDSVTLFQKVCAEPHNKSLIVWTSVGPLILNRKILFIGGIFGLHTCNWYNPNNQTVAAPQEHLIEVLNYWGIICQEFV